MRPFRLALTATVAALALAAPGGAHAEDCPGRHTPTEALEPAVCAGIGQDGWGGATYVYAGTCVEGEDACTLVKVPVEELVVAAGEVVDDVYDKIRP